MTLRETGIGLRIWLAKRKDGCRGANGKTFELIHAELNARRTLRQRYAGKVPGKGNKAWNRVKRLEAEWRRSGGFYLEDIYLGRI